MTSPTWRRVVILGVLAAACSPETHQDPFLVLAGPKDVMRIDVMEEGGGLLWSLEASSPAVLDAVLYGVVPSGFFQREPADGWSPRPLEPGELVTARTKTVNRLFTHIGVAKSPTTMEILNYKMELLESH